jgi:hypothetical protein
MSAAGPDKSERDRDLDAEQEIDLGRLWRATIARWWLPVLGLVVGAIIGLIVSLGGGKQWKATTEIYLGQPLSVGGGAQISSAPTSLGLATAYINQLYARRIAAKKSGIPARKLLGLTGTKIGQPAPLMLLSVTGAKGGEVKKAAAALAALVVTYFQPYSAQKIVIIQDRLNQELAQIGDINRRLKEAQDAQAKLAESPANAQLVANYAQIITTLSNERFASQSDITSARQSIAQARGVEQPRIVSPAVASNEGGPSRRSGVLIGAIIGFVLGLLAAILWEPIARTVRSHQADEQTAK